MKCSLYVSTRFDPAICEKSVSLVAIVASKYDGVCVGGAICAPRLFSTS